MSFFKRIKYTRQKNEERKKIEPEPIDARDKFVKDLNKKIKYILNIKNPMTWNKVKIKDEQFTLLPIIKKSIKNIKIKYNIESYSIQLTCETQIQKNNLIQAINKIIPSNIRINNSFIKEYYHNKKHMDFILSLTGGKTLALINAVSGYCFKNKDGLYKFFLSIANIKEQILQCKGEKYPKLLYHEMELLNIQRKTNNYRIKNKEQLQLRENNMEEFRKHVKSVINQLNNICNLVTETPAIYKYYLIGSGLDVDHKKSTDEINSFNKSIQFTNVKLNELKRLDIFIAPIHQANNLINQFNNYLKKIETMLENLQQYSHIKPVQVEELCGRIRSLILQLTELMSKIDKQVLSKNSNEDMLSTKVSNNAATQHNNKIANTLMVLSSNADNNENKLELGHSMNGI